MAAPSYPTDLISIPAPGPNPAVANSLGESHAYSHSQLKEVVDALQLVVGITNSADPNSLTYKINGLGGLTSAFGENARASSGGTTVTSADRGFLIVNSGGGAVVLPDAAAAGMAGFTVGIVNQSASLNTGLTGPNTNSLFKASQPTGGTFGVNALVLLPREMAILIADGAGSWFVIGGAGHPVSPVAEFPFLVNALTDAATIATDAATGNIFNVTIAASRTMGAPTNPHDGQRILYRIKQGGAGSNTITWDTIFDWGAGGAPTLSTAIGKIDLCPGIYYGNTAKWQMQPAALGYGP